MILSARRRAAPRPFAHTLTAVSSALLASYFVLVLLQCSSAMC
jgi:hypothetical protein